MSKPLDPNQPPTDPTNKTNGFQNQDVPNEKQTDVSPYDSLGVSGLWQASGYLNEEKLLQLRGPRAMAVYRQMSDNDATIGAILYAIEMMMRKVPWTVEAASDSPDDLEAAQFLESCMYDMSHSWESMISEIVQFLTYGWSCLEIVYKERVGPEETDPTKKSKYNDGLIGWRKLAGRAPESLHHWVFDEDGGVKGWWQWPPMGAGNIFLPIEKILLFRTTSKKNNPEGRSILRNSYVSWFHKKELERIESIGIERDLAGLPLLYIQPEMMDPNASDKVKAIYNEYKKILRNVRQDEQAGLIFPSVYDETGKRMVEFSLVGTGSRRQNITNEVITRYTQAIATSVMADFLLIGSNAVGSFAMATVKTQLFQFALGAFMQEIETVLNCHAVPRLFKINGFDASNLPKFVVGEIEKQQVEKLALALQQIVSSGMIAPGGMDDENFWRNLIGMPERTDVPQTAPGAPTDDSNYLKPPPPVPVAPMEPNAPPTEQAIKSFIRKLLRKR
jgi:hypothetical protein